MSIHPISVPAPALDPLAPLRPTFQQSFDRSRPHELLDVRTAAMRRQNKWPGSLVYRLTDTNEDIIVPNIWYNQPVAWRVAHLRWQARQQRDYHAKLVARGVAAKEPGRGTFYSAEEYRQDNMRQAQAMAERLEALAGEMERTGVVTH